MTNQQQISAGPSREELFDALRLRHEGRKVSFTVSSKSQHKNLSETLDFLINSIEIEDGSGNSWIIEAYEPRGYLGSRKLKVYFHTTRRDGYILSASL